MRSSALIGFCFLSLMSQVLAGCDDTDDRRPNTGGPNSTAGTENTAGTQNAAGKSGGGSTATGGSENAAGNAGTFATGGTFGSAGTDVGGSGGSAGTDSAGSGGSAGTAGAPSCTTDAQCADTNDCTDDACTNGQCAHTNNTAACNDGNDCTSTDTCSAGVCKGTNNIDVCDDLSSCTSNDKCAGGVCRGTKDRVACPSCDDALNIIQNCDFTEDLNHWADQILFGGSGTQSVINQRLVIDITGGGTHVYDVQPRQEPLALKQGMKYKIRMVVGSSVDRPIVVALTQAAGNYDVYSTGDNPAGGFTLNLKKQMKLFEFEFTMTRADDSNVKLELKIGGTEGNPSVVYFDDIYVAPVKCAGNAACDDTNPCTDDACNLAAGTCSWTNNTAACTADTNACTNDVCAAGVCSHAPLADNAACTDDSNACTNDVCTAGACTHEFNPGVCACTQNADCDDHKPCTDDACNGGTCEHADNTATCDDGNACTSTDVCAAGVCAGANNTAVCDDNDPCTVTDACAAGSCAGTTNVCFDCTVGGNLLTNCNLSNGATGWLPGFFDAGAGSQSVVGGRLVVNITNGGTDGYMIQPRQEGLELVQGTTYLVRFNAMASIARGMVLSLTQNGDPFASYSGSQTFALTTQMQEFHFEFTMNAAPPPPTQKVKFEIRLGGAANNPTVPNSVTFDNLFIGPKP